MRNTLTFVATLAILLASLPTVEAQQPRTVSRLFWQDDTSHSLRYGDVRRSGSEWSLEPSDIDGFPKLDDAVQSMVQMQLIDGMVLVGVHDHENGTIGSGWVAIESGAVEEPHGDHSHWHFHHSPKVHSQLIDQEQGNPAHVYGYGNHFVLANDKKNGFTLTSPKQIREAKRPADAAQFFAGGNGHITLALVEDKVVYSTWIARDGDDAGRVDVIGVGPNQGKSYSIQCPTGGLHGATTNHGRVFFAPADGVCWVDADKQVSRDSSTVQVHHVSLGQSADKKPLRTGAFTNLGKHVLFTSGKGSDSKLCWIDASAKSPAVGELKMSLADGQSVMTPIAIRTRAGQSLACLFRESVEDPASDALLFVDLDPNRDGDFADASLVSELAVGPNAVTGHAGHHDACLLGDRRHLAITNPGNGSLWIVSLTDFTVQAKIEVSGQPTRLVGIGG